MPKEEIRFDGERYVSGALLCWQCAEAEAWLDIHLYVVLCVGRGYDLMNDEQRRSRIARRNGRKHCESDKRRRVLWSAWQEALTPPGGEPLQEEEAGGSTTKATAPLLQARRQASRQARRRQQLFSEGL
jgi:hypothetical protein